MVEVVVVVWLVVWLGDTGVMDEVGRAGDG